MNSLKPGEIVKAQPDKTITLELISLLLLKLAKLYQIPNFAESNALPLADWIFANYQYDRLDSIVRTLSNPPIGEDKNWRLTPDTLQNWLSKTLEKEAIQREKKIQNIKLGSPDNDLDLLLNESVNFDGKDDPTEVTHNRDLRSKMVPLTEEEIEREGQEKPATKVHSTMHMALVAEMQERKIRYGRECTDMMTGKMLPGKPSFDEWELLEYPPF